jgi:putative salt-induced outer membrane protein YdiY
MRTTPFTKALTFAAVCLASLPVFAQDKAPIESQTSKWETVASAGATLTRGNSEAFLGTVSATTTRKWEHDQMDLGAMLTFGKNKDQATEVTSRTADSYRGFAQYDRLFSEKVYGYARVEGLYDSIAAVNYRFTISPGAGYYVIKDKDMDLSFELGPGYVIQKLGGLRSSFATLRAGEKFHYNLSDRARVWETVEWLPKIEDFSNYIINAEVGVAADLNEAKSFSISLVLQDVYNSVPAVGRKENDMKLVGGLNYKF